jgi:hypothetical protein
VITISIFILSKSARIVTPSFPFFFLSLYPIADIIAAVEFSHDGEYLATGDKGGRVVLFERNREHDVSLLQECDFHVGNVYIY